MACVNEFVKFAMGIEEGDSEMIILENILSIWHAKTDFLYLTESNLIESLNFVGNFYKGEIEEKSRHLLNKWKKELIMENMEDEMFHDLLLSLEYSDQNLNELFSDYVIRYTKCKRKREDDATGYNSAKKRKITNTFIFQNQC